MPRHREHQKLIDEQWRAFAAAVLPEGVSEVQRIETRRAFYAGAQALFHVLINVLDPGDEPTAADLAKMDDIQAEFENYAADLRAGRA